MDVCIYVNWLFVIYFLYSFGNCFGYFEWNVQPKTIVCSGDDAHLVWNYTTNETASVFLWQKLGSPNTLVARIFSGTFSVHTSYTGRVTQSNLGNAAIAISSVNTSDSGTYGCTIQIVNSENVTLIVAEQPSGMPYFNKTDNSLTCNPPQKLGSPPVETKLKLLPGGTVSSSLTTTKNGTYQCCISGEAVRCLSSLDSTVTEFCVNETLDLETTTTTMKPPGEGLSTGAVIGIVIGVLIAVVVVVVVFVYIYKKKGNAEDKNSFNTIRESLAITNTQARQSRPNKLPPIKPTEPTTSKPKKGKKVKKNKIKDNDQTKENATENTPVKSETHQPTQNDKNHD